jgi:hypothetical protein
MAKIDYVIREDGVSELIHAETEWDFLETDEILKNYPYLRDAMNKEQYYMENELCSFFDEIIFEKKVVGFATFSVRDDNILLLTECFILPEFRGNRLFFDEICKMNFVGPRFGILQPTRNVVELLLRYSFAKNVTEDIVASAVEFYFDDFDARSTKGRQLDDDEMEPSNFYDLSINSTIFVDGDEVIYHELLENDLTKNGKRKELDEDYFNGLRKFFMENEDELMELVLELKKELPQVEFGFNEVVGRGEGLSQFMQAVVDDDLISYEDALAIKEQLTREYDAGEITEGNVDERLLLLVNSKNFEFDGFGDFKDFVNTEGMVDEEDMAIKDFINLIGDNEELGEGILHALMTDDDEAFQNLILTEMAKDENFMDNFIDLANEYGGEDDFSPAGNSPLPFDLFGDAEDFQYKLDDTEYGKDYPVSYDRDIYHYLNSLDDNADFYGAMLFINMQMSRDNMLIGLMLHSQLIQGEADTIDWVNHASSFKKEELKEILRENGLKVSGNKPELLRRLADNDVPYGETYKITEKGKNYLKEFSWIEFYESFLYDFDFDDFYRYMDEHEGELKEVSLKYLDEHIKKARSSDDDEYLENCIFTKKVIMDEGDDFISGLDIPE